MRLTAKGKHGTKRAETWPKPARARVSEFPHTLYSGGLFRGGSGIRGRRHKIWGIDSAQRGIKQGSNRDQRGPASARQHAGQTAASDRTPPPAPWPKSVDSAKPLSLTAIPGGLMVTWVITYDFGVVVFFPGVIYRRRLWLGVYFMCFGVFLSTGPRRAGGLRRS